MICVHMKKLYQLCQTEGLKISSSDLVHIVCEQCGVQEACPSILTDEYDQWHADAPNQPQPVEPQKIDRS